MPCSHVKGNRSPCFTRCWEFLATEICQPVLSFLLGNSPASEGKVLARKWPEPFGLGHFQAKNFPL